MESPVRTRLCLVHNCLPRCALRLAKLRQPRPPACYAKYLVRSVGKLSEFGLIGLRDSWIGVGGFLGVWFNPVIGLIQIQTGCSNEWPMDVSSCLNLDL